MAKRRKRSKPSTSRLKHARAGARAAALFGEACAHHNAGRLALAEAGYRDVLASDPQFAPALFHLGLLAQAGARVETAIGYLQRAVEIDPRTGVYLGTLGSLLGELGRWDEARDALERAHRMAPADASIKFNLGAALTKTGEAHRAVALFKDVVRRVPDDPDGWSALGNALLDAHLPDEAIAAHRRAQALNPGSADAYNNLGAVYLGVGRFDEARTCFRRALELDPSYVKAAGNLSRTKRYTEADRTEIAAFEAMLDLPGLGPDAAAEVYFALGKAFDDLGDYSRAFEHYAQGNTLRSSRVTFVPNDRANEVRRLKQAFSGEYFRSHGAPGSTSELPVFIVGMPRSGTSLVEQIIASHSQGHGAGELSAIDVLSRKIASEAAAPYPECMLELTTEVLTRSAQWYLEQLPQSTGASRITDKMPGNFNHVGLIASLFPNARIIHCKRGAMDVCLSNYLHAFVEGNGFSFNLSDLAFEYRAYDGLMAHWAEVLPGRILDLEYEALVAEPQAQIPRLIAFCGLAWEDQCLRPHETQRQVHTASNWQVRQPIYRTSTEKWRRYAPYLRELEEGLKAGPL